MDSSGLDVDAAHRYFSVQCFNDAWKLLEKAARSPEDDRELVALSQVSLYHWKQRPDCTETNLSIGHWQVSRIHAMLGDADESLRQAEICLSHSATDGPFYVGYAYEALARAEQVAGRTAQAALHLQKAQQCAATVPDAEDREILLADLATIF